MAPRSDGRPYQQEALVSLVNRELKKTGENLDRPSWDKKERQVEQPQGEPPPAIVERARKAIRPD